MIDHERTRTGVRLSAGRFSKVRIGRQVPPPASMTVKEIAPPMEDFVPTVHKPTTYLPEHAPSPAGIPRTRTKSPQEATGGF